MIIAIVAIAKNLAIGKHGKLPWHYSEDLKFFRRTTTGHAVVMGFNTWKSIGKPLPNRTNIVLSRSATVDDPAVRTMRDRREVLDFESTFDGDVFIIGGSQTFESFAERIEKWLVTEIPITVEDADTFMPADFLDGFARADSTKLGADLVVHEYLRKSAV